MVSDRIGMALILLAFCTFVCTSCVSSFTQHTYTIQITATSGGVTHSTPLQVTISSMK